MQPVLPFWFVQRQAKAEPAGDNIYRLTAPNLREAFVVVQPADAGWTGALRSTADGENLSVSQRYETQSDAWYAAFELYRNQIVI